MGSKQFFVRKIQNIKQLIYGGVYTTKTPHCAILLKKVLEHRKLMAKIIMAKKQTNKQPSILVSMKDKLESP